MSSTGSTNLTTNTPSDAQASPNLLLCYARCSTCAKARVWLKEHDVPYVERDIKSDHPNVQELTQWYHESGLPIRRFFNTSGQRYRELHLKDRLPSMSDQEALELLASDGMLVKRPLIVNAHNILVGFQPKAWGAVLSSTGDALE